ncbi:hypothetical protein BaRGS_00002760 [Batillaria attramentaria]|uniref:E3 ubiquitin-protein ligase n=1 Tax=Batillaria attramentaria TaxID=370345 RepID=A0ABD0M3U2_9CAEN
MASSSSASSVGSNLQGAAHHDSPQSFLPSAESPRTAVVWEWSVMHQMSGTLYDMEIAVLIEDAFHSGKGMLDLSTSQFRLPYTVRIQTGKTRTIRRTSLKVPYPSAAAAPMSFSRLTSQLPATLHVNQPSASCQPGPSASSPMMMVPAAVPASNSVTHKRTFSTSGVDSGSDSDDGSGKSPPGRHGKYRRSTRSKSAASGAAGAPVSKGSKSSGLPSATQTSGSTQASTASGLASTSLSSLALSQTSPARTSMPGMLPPGVVASSRPPASAACAKSAQQPYVPQFPLSLVTYAQPLGANLTRGFPPMTHVPPSPNSKSQPYQHLQQQAAPQHNGWPPMHVTNVPSASQTLGRLAPSQPNPSLHSQSTSSLPASVKSRPRPGTHAGLFLLLVPRTHDEKSAEQRDESELSFSASKTAEEVLSKYMEKVSPQENEDCCICCDALTGPSSYGEGQPGQFDVIQLNKCSHMFHRLCLLAMYDSSHNHDSIQCPTCKTIYGEYIGNCPPGEMSFDIIQRSLPGFPGCNTIRGPEHPHPGRRFTARGFPRTGYLPDTDRGRKILKMLILAFKRRLMFTIGQSATTGEGDTVTWNEIHHKTEFGSNVSGHGYPDPNYLDNVTAELALKGVTDQDL